MHLISKKKIKYGSELFDSNVLHMSKLTFEENDLQFLKLKRRKQHQDCCFSKNFPELFICHIILKKYQGYFGDINFFLSKNSPKNVCSSLICMRKLVHLYNSIM